MAWVENAAAVGRAEPVAQSGFSGQQRVEAEDECPGGGECEEYGRGSVSPSPPLVSAVFMPKRLTFVYRGPIPAALNSFLAVN